MACLWSFSLDYHNVHFKCIIISGVAIILSFKKIKRQSTFPFKITKKKKKPSSRFPKFLDQKICAIVELSRNFKIYYKKECFFHKIFDNRHLKFGKTKRAKFKK